MVEIRSGKERKAAEAADQIEPRGNPTAKRKSLSIDYRISSNVTFPADKPSLMHDSNEQVNLAKLKNAPTITSQLLDAVSSAQC